MNLEILEWNIKIVFGFSFRIIWKIMQIKEGVVVSLSKQIKKKKQKLLLASKMRTCSRIFGACGQRHFVYCIARFLQNLSTFLGYPCSANQYAWYVAVKALVLRLRSIWCPHWNQMNVNFRITRNNICSIRNANTRISGIHVTFCSIMYQRQFALPTGNLFTKRNKSSAWSQLSAV